MINKLLTTNTKLILVLALGLLITWAGWRIYRAASSSNLFQNSSFNSNDLTHWITQGSENSDIVVKTSDGETHALLQIPNSATRSWVGVGQRAAITSNQQYRIAVDVQIEDSAPAALLLRVSQFDIAGSLLNTDEIPVAVNMLPGQPWQTEQHNFTAVSDATEVEIGVGLIGTRSASVKLNNFTLAYSPTWVDIFRRDILLTGTLLVLLAMAAAYPARGAIIAHRRAIGLIAVNILLFVIFAELAALGIYLIRDGRFFYTTPPEPIIAPAAANRPETELTTFRIHPYFGYINKVGMEHDPKSTWATIDAARRTANNHGFFSEVDYPFSKSHDNQFIIGVFGGSVAEQFALIAHDTFIEELKRDPFFATKEIIVLNFAKAGYKQPQQLLILSYFLSVGQHMDMVINIDGFNEVALGYRNFQAGIDPSMPHRGYFSDLAALTDQAALTPEKLETLAKINRYQTQLNWLANRHQRARTASTNFVLKQLFDYHLNNYYRELGTYSDLTAQASDTSLLFVKPDNSAMEATRQFEQMAQNWADSSIMMADILRGWGIPYVHILQPNQYYSAKQLTAEELEIAILQDHPRFYDSSATQGYPLLLQKVDTLKQHSIYFFDATSIFDNVRETIYRDNCCHYNLLGNNMLAQFAARSITGPDGVVEEWTSMAAP